MNDKLKYKAESLKSTSYGGTDKQFRLSRNQYYQESHMRRNERRSRKWGTEIKEVNNRLRNASLKTCKLEIFEQNIRTKGTSP